MTWNSALVASALLAMAACSDAAPPIARAAPDCRPEQQSDAVDIAACTPPAAPLPEPPAAPPFHPPVDTIDPACSTRQLTIGRAEGDAGGGHGAELIVFSNHGRTCQLTGYPEVGLLDAAGHIVEQADHTLGGYLGGYGGPDGAALPQVRLTTGATASAVIEGIHGALDGDPRPCPLYTAYRVTPPGQHSSARVTARDGVCYPAVHPIVPGIAERYPPPN